MRVKNISAGKTENTRAVDDSDLINNGRSILVFRYTKWLITIIIYHSRIR